LTIPLTTQDARLSSAIIVAAAAPGMCTQPAVACQHRGCIMGSSCMPLYGGISSDASMAAVACTTRSYMLHHHGISSLSHTTPRSLSLRSHCQKSAQHSKLISASQSLVSHNPPHACTAAACAAVCANADAEADSLLFLPASQQAYAWLVMLDLGTPGARSIF
jgi:hypothetical protein